MQTRGDELGRCDTTGLIAVCGAGESVQLGGQAAQGAGTAASKTRAASKASLGWSGGECCSSASRLRRHPACVQTAALIKGKSLNLSESQPAFRVEYCPPSWLLGRHSEFMRVKHCPTPGRPRVGTGGVPIVRGQALCPCHPSLCLADASRVPGLCLVLGMQG